jgi:hypothetical protein
MVPFFQPTRDQGHTRHPEPLTGESPVAGNKDSHPEESETKRGDTIPNSIYGDRK